MKMVQISRRRTSLLVALAAGTIGSLAGCDQTTEAQRKVDDGSRQLVAMSGGGSAPADPTDRQKAYASVSSACGSVGEAMPGEKAAGSLLVATSQDGLGELTTVKINDLEGKARTLVVKVHNGLSQWSAFGAVAIAAEAVDVSSQLADLAKSKADRDRDLASETQRRNILRASHDDIAARAKAKLDAAQVKVAEAVRLRDQAASLSATEATPTIERAAAVNREGEALRVQGLGLQAEAEAVAPRLSESEAIIAKLIKQKEDLTQIEASVQARAAAARQEATESRAAGAKVAAELVAIQTELESLRAGDLAKEYDAALSLYGKSASAAKAAQAGGKASAGKLAAGSAALSIAQTHWGRAQGIQSYAALLTAMAAAKPSLPNHSDIQTKLATAITDQKAALGEAEKALNDAKSAFSSAGVQGPSKERLEAVVALLDKAIETAKDENLDAAGKFGFRSRVPAPVTAAPAPTSAVEPTAAPSGDDAAAIRGQLKWMVDAQESLRETVTKADEACKAKFSKSLKEVLASNPMTAAAGGQLEPQALKLEDIQVTVTGDTATATIPGSGMAMPFRKVDGKWQAPEQLGGPAAQKMVGFASKALAAWTTDISADKFETAEAATQGLMSRFMALQMQMMGDGK